ncbi:hypothetical protein [Natrialbaceae archaeon AArc-T1-2]|uniref:hypothetical protein n=1 Tax=Natrialbaceae archaeon AArc-T1-2 TaxID=3053904 RepID=UPI00255B0CA4|nr:hypothetical protein [Natrialbaceae archaeon AArc-T1-2]WIV68082.1 hypothetical protein QQ977_04960 [Natrialbaceae archaeon AArc-T1-2]
MVSRETIVHVCAVLLAVFLLFALEYAGILPETGPAPVWVALLFYGLVFGGAHLYLALRGEGGIVPVEARWRYLAMLVVLLGAGAVIVSAGDRSIVGVELESVGIAVVVLTVLVYFVDEAVAGYRSARPE